MLCAALLLAACSGETRDEVPAAVAAPVADGQDDHGPYQGLESFTVEGAAELQEVEVIQVEVELLLAGLQEVEVNQVEVELP